MSNIKKHVDFNISQDENKLKGCKQGCNS